MGGLRVHGVGGWCAGGGGVDGLRVHGVGAYTHPPIKGYSVNIFIFLTPIQHIQSVTLTKHILWMVHGVGGGWW